MKQRQKREHGLQGIDGDDISPLPKLDLEIRKEEKTGIDESGSKPIIE
jgi:hypothetical protein